MATKAIHTTWYTQRDMVAGALVSIAIASMLPDPGAAASFGPPMLDITSQCSANSRRNVAAMSECVVAESEARAEMLQKWHKVSDENAERCIKLGRQGQKFPYMKIAACLAAAPAPAAPEPQGNSKKGTSNKTAPAKPAATKPATGRR